MIRPQFSLRVLLLVVTVCCLIFATTAQGGFLPGYFAGAFVIVMAIWYATRALAVAGIALLILIAGVLSCWPGWRLWL